MNVCDLTKLADEGGKIWANECNEVRMQCGRATERSEEVGRRRALL